MKKNYIPANMQRISKKYKQIKMIKDSARQNSWFETSDTS